MKIFLGILRKKFRGSTAGTLDIWYQIIKVSVKFQSKKYCSLGNTLDHGSFVESPRHFQ